MSKLKHRFAVIMLTKGPAIAIEDRSKNGKYFYQAKMMPRSSGPRALFDFVKENRLQCEPPTFDILKDLFPEDASALDRIEMELMKQQLISYAEESHECTDGTR